MFSEEVLVVLALGVRTVYRKYVFEDERSVSDNMRDGDEGWYNDVREDLNEYSCILLRAR